MAEKRTDAERRVRQVERFSRLLRVLNCISGSGRWDAVALAKELECSRRTIHRLLQTLSMAGVPWYFDEITKAYVQDRAARNWRFYDSDPDAVYMSTLDIDVSMIEPQVAFPHLPSNAKGISDVGDIRIDQVVIGSCTNGRIEDLRVAAGVLKGRKTAPYVRLIVIPATPQIYRMALQEGLIEIFLDAGAAVSTPTCGPCLGGYMGILAEGERAVSTTNRNFVGRMGHKGSEVYLASPAIAAASAVLGKVAGPDAL